MSNRVFIVSEFVTLRPYVKQARKNQSDAGTIGLCNRMCGLRPTAYTSTLLLPALMVPARCERYEQRSRPAQAIVTGLRTATLCDYLQACGKLLHDHVQTCVEACAIIYRRVHGRRLASLLSST